MVDLVKAACIHWTAADYGGDALSALDQERADHENAMDELDLDRASACSCHFDDSECSSVCAYHQQISESHEKQVADLRRQLEEAKKTTHH